MLNKITLTPQGTQKVLLQLKEIPRLREHKVAATGPAGATGGAGPSTRCYTSEGDNRCSVRELKERQVHKEQKMIQVLTEIQELREHKVRAGGPAAATGGDGSTTRCNSSSRGYRFSKRRWSTRCYWS